MVDTLHARRASRWCSTWSSTTPAESDLDGPTLSWRGLGQARLVRHGQTHGVPHNFTGTGNSLERSASRACMQWVLDSLRWWVQGASAWTVSALTSPSRWVATRRWATPSTRAARCSVPWCTTRCWRNVRLIAEPWDVGPERLPAGWIGSGLGWSGTTASATACGPSGSATTARGGELANAGCARQPTDVFRHPQPRGQRRPVASMNMVTAHDGFNLARSHRLPAQTQRT
jgi:pullulanase/glycogen debranching enzyme